MNKQSVCLLISFILLLCFFGSTDVVADENEKDKGTREEEMLTSNNTLMEPTMVEQDGKYSHIISSGTNCFTFACETKPDKICYCHDPYNQTVTLDPGGQDIFIEYILNVVHVGPYTNPETGATGEAYTVTTNEQ